MRGRTPMALTRATDSVLEYRLRAGWRIALAVVGLGTFIPLAVSVGGDMNRLGPWAPLAFAGFLAGAVGALATFGLRTAWARRRLEVRDDGSVLIDVEEPHVSVRQGPIVQERLQVSMDRLELEPGWVKAVIVERAPVARPWRATRIGYRVALELGNGQRVHPWWDMFVGSTAEDFVQDAALRMRELLGVDDPVVQRDTVELSALGYLRENAPFLAPEHNEALPASTETGVLNAFMANPIHPTATMPRRALALLIDTALCVLLLIGLFRWTQAPDSVIFDFALPAYFLLRLGYHTVYEALFGATLGKRLVRLRVIATDGGQVGFARAFRRNIARIVDSIAFYLVGGVAAYRRERSQRFGDSWAGTLVVDDRKVKEALEAYSQTV